MNCECHYQRPETHEEKCIRWYNLAKQVAASLRKQGKLNDIPACNPNIMQIELYKNILCQVNAEGNLSYGYALRFYAEKNEIEKRLKL